MDYVYDIVLNFQKEYYEFYEWKSSDKIINVEKIPIYKISTKDYLNIKNNEVTINKDSIPKKNKMFLLTSGIEIIGIIINNNGKVIKKSSLIFEESDDVLKDKDEIKLINIKYHVDKVNKITYKSRISKERSNYIKEYLKKIDKIKDEYLIKYIYFEIFSTEEKNTDNAYNKLIELSKNDINRLYNAIKSVNLEIKNPFN